MQSPSPDSSDPQAPETATNRDSPLVVYPLTGLLMVVVAVGVFLIHLSSLERNPTAERFGFVIGSVTAVFILPGAIALVVGLISKSRKAANIVFAILLVLWGSSQLRYTPWFAERAQQRAEVQAILDRQKDARMAVANAETPEEMGRRAREVVDDSVGLMGKLIDGAKGKERALLEVMNQEGMLRIQATYTAYQDTQEDFLAHWGPEALSTSEGREESARLLAAHEKAAQRHADSFRSIDQRITTAARQAGVSDRHINQALKGIHNELDAVIPIQERSFALDMQWIESLKAVIQLLDENSSTWTPDDGQFLFFDDDLLAEFNGKMETVAQCEAARLDLAKEFQELVRQQVQ